MDDLGKIVHPTNALFALVTGSPLQLSDPASPAPHPSEASTLDALQALLIEQDGMEANAQKQMRRRHVYLPIAMVAAFIACSCFAFSCVLMKRRVKEVFVAGRQQWQQPLPEQQQREQEQQQPLPEQQQREQEQQQREQEQQQREQEQQQQLPEQQQREQEQQQQPGQQLLLGQPLPEQQQREQEQQQR